MPAEEFLGWLEYLSWQNEAERKAYKDAQKKSKRGR